MPLAMRKLAAGGAGGIVAAPSTMSNIPGLGNIGAIPGMGDLGAIPGNPYGIMPATPAAAAAPAATPAPTPSIPLSPTYAQFAQGRSGAPSATPYTGGTPPPGMNPAMAADLQSIYAPIKQKKGGIAHMDMGGMPFGEEVPWFERTEERGMADMPHSGLLNSSVAGRTDRLPIAVATNSYVVPADVVSGLGQGNTLAGARILNEALRTGPWGTDAGGAKIAHGNIPRPPRADMEMAKGGKAEHMPIIAAGGEFVVPPHVVERIGKGDMTKGHRILDEMVRRVRVHTVKKISSLPKPKK